MPKALSILGLAAIVGLTVAWWTTRDGRRPLPPAPADALAPTPIAPDETRAPMLVGASDAPLAASPAAADGPTTLTGRVLRLDTRKPVPEAAVAIRWEGQDLARTSTASDGRFRLDVSVPNTGPWAGPLLVVSAAGLTTLQAMSPSRGDVVSGDVGDLLLEPGWTVRGAVRGEGGERVAGARVVVQPDRPADGAVHRAGSWGEVARRQQTVSDADGQFAFTGLPPRRFDVEVLAEGYVSAWYRGSVVADRAWLDLRLRRGRSMPVRVEDMAGRPVAGARVNLYLSYRRVFAGHYKTHLRLDRSTVTDVDGRCVLTGLQDRNYQITAQAGGLAEAATYVLPGWPETVIRLRPGWLSTRYVYEDGPGGGNGSVLPQGMDGGYAWTCWPPRPEEPAPPSAPSARHVARDRQEVETWRPPPPSDRARLHVTVLAADGVPLPRAYVGFAGPDEEAVITEENGTGLVSLAPGRYTFRVSPLDFGTPAADLHGTVDAQGGVESQFVFRLPLVYAVTVEVQTADGAAVPRAEVQILRGAKTMRRWADSVGRIHVFAERNQTFALLSQPDGHAAAFLEDVHLPVRRPVILRAPRSTTLSGRVLGPDGAPVFGAYVEARRAGLASVGEEEWTAFTDDRGSFVLAGPAADRYAVRARHRAFGASTVILDGEPRAEPLILRLKPLVRLRGRVVDEAGEPIARAEIELRATNRERGYGWVGTGDEGRFEIALARGAHGAEVLVTREGFVTRVVPVTPGVPGGMEIHLEAQ